MARLARLTALFISLLVAWPMAVPSEALAQSPPHVRRRPPPPPRHAPRPAPPHVRRRVAPHVHHQHYVAPTPRPRYGIAADPRTSVYVGFGPVANFVAEGDDRISQIINTGGGLELFLGFRFSQWAAFELGGLFTFHGTKDVRFEDGVFNAITGDVKVFVVPSSRRIEPFLQLGAGAYLFSRGWEDNELTGAGFQLGGGVDVRLNRVVAVGGRFLWRGVYLDNSQATYWYGGPYESTFMNLFTLSANLQLHF